MDWLRELTGWHWMAIAMTFFALEILMPSVFFLWPALAALAVAVILFFAPDITAVFQILVFAVLSIVALSLWRLSPWAKSKATDTPHLNRRADQYVGRRATVVEPFENGRGAVQIDDTRWAAATLDGANPRPGDHVEIRRVEGTLLSVSAQKP